MSAIQPTSTQALTGLAWAPDPVDDAFQQPYVDVDEWRDAPVEHRYIHGGFRDGDTRFSLYLPPEADFQGRFFQHVTPVPQSENLAQARTDDENPISFAIDSGAFFLETNGGGPLAADPMSGLDPTIGAYRANAAVARFARQIAAELFGDERVFGYLYGGSGGGFRTIGAAENTDGVWDGFVPYVIGSPMAIPNVFAVRMHAQRILRDKFPEIVDAYDAGGDPDALDFTDEERAAFVEVTRMGFPPRSWFGWETMGMHGFSALYPGILAADPTYTAEFWTTEGYLGSDPDASVHSDRVQLATTIAEMLIADDSGARSESGGVDESYKQDSAVGSTIGARISESPTGWSLGAELLVRSGAAAGALIRLADVSGDRLTFEGGQPLDVLESLRAGDAVVLDNSNFLAAQTYHRHQVPDLGYEVWDQFRDDRGEPRFPQRSMLLGPMFTAFASGSVPTGRITGKMIVVDSLLDREAFPWQADWYRTQVAAHLGAEIDDAFRLWFTDNALHGDDAGTQEPGTRNVSYGGALEAALRQLSAWVERGVEPAATTAYSVVDGQILVDPRDPHRGGVQPIVELTADGGTTAKVGIGQTVGVHISARAVDGGSKIVQVATDLSGEGILSDPFDVGPAVEIELDLECTFDRAGTFFLTARVASQDEGSGGDPHARVQNLARARVVVTR